MLSSGREFLSIPGPTVVPDAVLAAMQKPAVDIYSGPLVALTDTLLAVRDGCVGRRRRDGRLAEGADDAAGLELHGGGRACARGAQDRRHAHALLGLDVPRRRAALPQILRHAAGAPLVRPARRARH